MKKQKHTPSGKPFTTAHKLPFLSCPWHRDPNWNEFKIGTCEGLWKASVLTYDILSIINDKPGNGHLEDVFQWFSASCRRDGKDLRVLEIMNEDFLRHLIQKRGFVAEGDSCIKKFT